jgi:hypothetical protein
LYRTDIFKDLQNSETSRYLGSYKHLLNLTNNILNHAKFFYLYRQF